jgi:hypothetical protein
MLGFNGLNLNTSTLVDYYNAVNDKNNDTIATAIANSRSNKNRASATAIGATFGLVQGAAFAGVYAGAKAYPKLQKFFPIKWAVGKVDEWINIAMKNYPNESKLYNIGVGVVSKSLWLVLSGAVMGFAFDLYKTMTNTKLDGKFSNVKQGALNDSWLISGLKSLSDTQEGQKTIRNAMKPVDNGIIIKFKGVDKEYLVTNKELKAANKEYLTKFNKDNGKVSGYKKHYSTGDGDVLAFEIAFRKYQYELATGKIKANPNLPKCANQYSSNGSLSETNISQFYYFLTGNEPQEISNNPFDMNEKAKLTNLMSDYSKNPEKYAIGFKFKDSNSGSIDLKNKFKQNVKLPTDKTLVIKNISSKYVTIIDPKNTKNEIQISSEDFTQNFDKIYASNLKSH